MADTIKRTYLSTAQIFRILHQWYTLWQELRQLQPTGQQHTNRDTNHRLPQTLPPQDECITEIWQKWTLTPFEDHITISQDLSQEPQVNTVELFFDLHFPNVTQQRINTPPVVHNDCTLKEFIQGEERCLKFINQDLTFLQELHILSTFTNVSNTTTSLKELAHINLPTRTSNEHSSIENTTSSCTQSIQPTLGSTPAKVCQAESNPTLTVPQLLEIEPCREYTETPLKMLDGLYVMQPKRFLTLTQEAKKLAKEFCKEEIAFQWAEFSPEKLVQESFLEQLDALQALDQLAPLTAVKEHLPGDNMDILACLGEVDNIPFNQLHSLVEDCADRYYTKVIQMLTRLMKNSFHNRQLILINTARALKFLESYAS